MKYAQWLLPDKSYQPPMALLRAGYPALAALVLAARGKETPELAKAFLSSSYQLLHDPFLLRDMDKAVERIRLALARGEKIAVFGDYDVDGITATCLLTDYLRSQGADCLRYIPRRIEDGYGLAKDALLALAQQGVTLVVTVDCGITGVGETEYAKTLGVELVITDHHACKEQLPAAAAVVDPHRPDCPYPFKALAGVGVALKLVLALGGGAQREKLFTRYAPLAAIGTVADVMSMTDENRTIVHHGLENCAQAAQIGLHALLKESGLESGSLSSVQVGFVLSPRINAAGRMGAADVAADLLMTQDPLEAERLARALCALNRERQQVEQEIFRQASEQAEALPEEERRALVLADGRWHQGVVGIVASRLSEQYGCPSFMIHLGSDGHGKGSCRSFGGLNLVSALSACSDLLEGFGGHELAAGFTIAAENIPAFRRRMNEYVRTHTGGEPGPMRLTVDVLLTQPQHLTLQETEALQILEPYGTGNNRPVFCLAGAVLDAMQPVGQNKHLKLRLSKGQRSFDGIFFSATAEDCGVRVGQRVDVVFYLQVNEFRGSRSLQMQVLDLRPSLFPSVREEEALSLCRRCVEGAPVTRKEATRLLPAREQFAALWRALQTSVPGEGLCTQDLPFLRQLAQSMTGTETLLRTALGLEVFAERGLLTLERGGEHRLFLRRTEDGKKVELAQCPYLQGLQATLSGGKA